MAKKLDLYERVDAAIADGKLWRAREILQGNIATRGYDTELFERYGQVLDALGDRMEAGKYLFLSGERKPEYEDAIALYLSRASRSSSHQIISTFPRSARLRALADYPAAVQRALRELGVEAKTLARWASSAPRATTRADRAGALGCLIFFLGILVLACIGAGAVLAWILGQWR